MSTAALAAGGKAEVHPRRSELLLLLPVAALVPALVLVLGTERLGWSAVDNALAPWWLVAAGFLAAEAYAVLADGPIETSVLAPHDAVVALGLYALGPSLLLGSQLAGTALALLLLRRCGWRSAAARLSVLLLGSSVAVAVFHGLGATLGFGGAVGWAILLAAVLAGGLTKAAPGWLRRRAPGGGAGDEPEPVRGVFVTVAAAAASTSLAIAAIELIRAEQVAALLLLVPFLARVAVRGAEASEHSRLAILRLLHEPLRAMHRAPGLDAGVMELLATTRRLFAADVAWVALLPRRGSEAPLVAGIAPEGSLGLRPRALTETQASAVARLVASERGMLLDATRAEVGSRALLSELRMAHALAMPLRGDGEALGVLVAGRRDGDRGAFGGEELRLFETYASHVAILLENDRLEESVTELEELKEQLRHQAYHDSLTGLPNRALFAESVAAALRREGSSAAPAVLFLDLDDFKIINDSLGHHAGDEVLRAMAGRVRSCVRAADLPARLGGDEFAVLTAAGGAAEAERVATRLVAALDEPFMVSGRELSVHASVGIAVGRPGVTSAEELLRNADVAMYGAKQSGKRRFVVYEPQMHARVQRRQQLATALERAASRGEIAVHYQPIVDLETRTISGVEALARWDRPQHGLLAPVTFIPLADEMGLMVDIGRVVLRQACAQARSWQTSFPGCDQLRINVNLAPSELHDATLADEVARVLEETGLDPARLVLEITESGVMRSPEQARCTMERLRALGVSLSLDDFGTGHSALAYLREFPLDQLKIAREFVAGLPEGHVDSIFVDTIVRLGTSLGLDVVAEGIESDAQASVVARLGCARGQGYYFGEPLSGIGVAGYLSSSALPAGAALVGVA